MGNHTGGGQEKLIESLFEKGILINKEFLEKGLEKGGLDGSPEGSFFARIEQEADLLVLNLDYADILVQQTNLVDWYEIDKYRVDAEKYRDDEPYQLQLQSFKHSNLILKTPRVRQEQGISSLEVNGVDGLETSGLEAGISLETGIKASLKTEIRYAAGNSAANNFAINNAISNSTEGITDVSNTFLPPCFHPNKVEIVISYQNQPSKYEVKDFTQLFVSRYKFLEGLLRNRLELQTAMCINKLLSKKEKEKIALMGLVEEIAETKNGNLMVTIEDLTGKIKVFISNAKSELYQKGKELVLDEMVGISGVNGDKIIFAEEIVWPDIPANNVLKKGEEEEYALFISDVHSGSKWFMKKEFEKFLSWVKGDVGNEDQKNLAKKVKYIVIAGDLVDGVGIYPSQLEELEVNDIKKQYELFCSLIKAIPQDKQIILCPGNHDAVHLAEPQSSFDERFSSGLFELPNVVLVTNPAVVNIAKTKTFSGFNILLYHGASFDYFVNNVEAIRSNGGYHRSDLVMKFLLKRRHLAPTFKSTPYFPAYKDDPLLIKTIPDFFVSGHIHYSNVANYKGVTMICGSCWQEKTSFQEKMGHEPEPARVPIVNLKTREIKILKFR